MRVHLGGIGKGYAIDRAVAMLKQRGFADFMIQSGGDLYVAGTNGGQPWKLAIADPRGDARTVRDAADRATARSAPQATTSDRSSRTACAITT